MYLKGGEGWLDDGRLGGGGRPAPIFKIRLTVVVKYKKNYKIF